MLSIFIAALALTVNDQAVRVEPMRCSAMPVNIRWPGHQRELDQTEICHFARFDLTAPAEVVVTAPRAFTNAVVRPVSKKVAVKRAGDKIRFTLATPGAYSVELDGRHENLMVFADRPRDWSDVSRTDPKVRHYGPGEHDVGLIVMKAGETLFLDEGAVVYGRIEAKDAPGIRICGKGILDASRVKEVPIAIDPKLAEEQRKKGWAITNVKRFNTIDIHFCDNVRIEGITIRDSQIYAVRPVCCDNLTIENVKVLGSWRYNSDGIDMHNCRKVRIRDSFIRTYDDSICVKGFDYCLPASEMTRNGVVHDLFEDVLVERCTIWNDWGRALEIGAETRGREIRDITFRDCDVLAVNGIALDVQNCDEAHVHDVRFEDIRVEYDTHEVASVYSASAKDFNPIAYRPPAPLTGVVIHYIPEYSKAGAENRGRTTDILFRNIDVSAAELPGGWLKGFDADHRVERVTFDNIRLNGKDVTADYIASLKNEGFVGSYGSPAAVGRAPGVCREAKSVPGEAASLLPEGKDFRLVWHDEFNGTALDGTKWNFRTNFWGRRASWFAAPEDGAVEVKDGVARLKIVKRADGSYCSPQLQTGGLVWDDMIDQSTAKKGSGLKWPFPKRESAKFLHRFGYWECRFRLQEKPGWWSAFWMQSPDQGATVDPRRSGIEQDVLESFDPGRYIVHAFHYNGYGSDYKRFNAQRAPYTPTADGAFKVSYPLSLGAFHTVGLLWEPDGYTVFVDGRQSGYKVGLEGDEAVSHAEEFLLLTTEIKGFRANNAPDPEAVAASATDDAFVVDYVRVYDIVPQLNF